MKWSDYEGIVSKRRDVSQILFMGLKFKPTQLCITPIKIREKAGEKPQPFPSVEQVDVV